jgi:DNA modification methylase
MSPPEPYYSDESVQLYVGDCRELVPALNLAADCILTDPPYESTSLAWDKWPEGWLEAAASAGNSMWCFLPLRQFAGPPFRGQEFHASGWRLSHDVIWQKQNATNRANDRFRCVHEQPAHWYRGRWGSIYHQAVRVPHDGPPQHHGHYSSPTPHVNQTYKGGSWTEDGTRLKTSVISVPGMWRRGAIHPTEKPVGILTPLIEYACPPGGLVVDLFAGSGSTLDAARQTGRRAIGIEVDGEQAEKIARRLSRPALPAEPSAAITAITPDALPLFDLPSASPAA